MNTTPALGLLCAEAGHAGAIERTSVNNRTQGLKQYGYLVLLYPTGSNRAHSQNYSGTPKCGHFWDQHKVS